MTAENLNRTLRAFQRRTPFKPFKVELVSGYTLQIDHPAAVAFRDGVAVFFGKEGMIEVFDHEGVSQVLSEPLQQTG